MSARSTAASATGVSGGLGKASEKVGSRPGKQKQLQPEEVRNITRTVPTQRACDSRKLRSSGRLLRVVGLG